MATFVSYNHHACCRHCTGTHGIRVALIPIKTPDYRAGTTMGKVHLKNANAGVVESADLGNVFGLVVPGKASALHYGMQLTSPCDRVVPKQDSVRDVVAALLCFPVSLGHVGSTRLVSPTKIMEATFRLRSRSDYDCAVCYE